jgi:hypothetical protein
MHNSVIGYSYGLPLESLDEIGSYINIMSVYIVTDNEYYEDFKRLQNSYQIKLRK